MGSLLFLTFLLLRHAAYQSVADRGGHRWTPVASTTCWAWAKMPPRQRSRRSAIRSFKMRNTCDLQILQFSYSNYIFMYLQSFSDVSCFLIGLSMCGRVRLITSEPWCYIPTKAVILTTSKSCNELLRSKRGRIYSESVEVESL